MMWLKIALMAVILYQCSCSDDIECNNMYLHTPLGESECIQEDSKYENEEVASCEVDTSNITWTFLNTRNGAVSLEFNLNPKSCGYKSYILELFVEEEETNTEECVNKSYTLEPFHSRRSVKMLNKKEENGRIVPSCGKTATVTFNYVYSGCYFLVIAPIKSGVPDYYYSSLPIFVQTDYKKDLLIKKTPRITSQYITTRQQIDVSVQFGLLEDFQDLHMGFRLLSDINPSEDRPCYVSGHEHSCCNYRTSGQFMCKMRNQMTDKPSCHIGKDEIRWSIDNVTAGFYCVLVEIFDDRCVQNSVWNNNSYCTYNSKVIEVLPTSPLQGEPTLLPPATPVDIILGTVFVVLVVVCLCVLLFIWLRRRPSSEPDPTRFVEKLPLSRRPRILLLYSRDCKLFMNTMTTFRGMLKEVTKCEVYDCFDPLREEELCRSKVDWLTAHITCPEVKVVIIESQCAVLHQTALIQHMKLIYEEPTWLDDLFTYGLKVLREDLQKNTYGRVFVVRIHGFTEESDNLCHITPYTRYVIPQNTEKLLSSLYQQSSLEYILILNENTDSNLQKLQEDIRSLEVFKQQNRDYLYKLFEKDIKEFV